MKSTRGLRRGTAVAACALLVTSATFLSACGNPKPSLRNCVGAPDNVMQAIQEQVVGGQTIRNGRMVHLRGAQYRFISAELHPQSDDPHDKGDIATWATEDVESADGFLAVDVHAREESTWPDAPFEVNADGAIESRACTSQSTGKTRAQIECEQGNTSGAGADLPGGKDCSDL